VSFFAQAIKDSLEFTRMALATLKVKGFASIMPPSSDHRAYEYQVGGSLGVHAPSYVERKADRVLYQALKAGKFCYVFNSRQMGKSSLRVRTMHRLRSEGACCVAIDLTRIGTEYVEPSQWYQRIISEICRGAQLSDGVNLKQWFAAHADLAMVQLLDAFIAEVLLPGLPQQQIVIFIDEIDSILGLNFQINDFFALIRACYNQRVDNAAYERLSFCLLGVATPSDLMRDKTRTPFNIGQQIALNGFSGDEIAPLVQGLVGRVTNPTEIVQKIVYWTGGQPFLTQKICQLVQLEAPAATDQSVENELTWLRELIRAQIITGWESQDEPEHFRTIEDRLLRNESVASRLLGIYQDILEQKSVVVDNSEGQSELLLSGLVVKQGQRLIPCNLIYQHVFDVAWVKRTLDHIRPYSVALNAWLIADRQDNSRLLSGQALEDALNWAAGRHLSGLDADFLRESQNYDSWLAKRAYSNLQQKNRRNVRNMRNLGYGLLSLLLIVGFYLHLQIWQRRLATYQRALLLDPTSQARIFEARLGTSPRSSNAEESLILALAMMDVAYSPTSQMLSAISPLGFSHVARLVPGLEGVYSYRIDRPQIFRALSEDNLNADFTALISTQPFIIDSTEVSEDGNRIVAKGSLIREPNLEPEIRKVKPFTRQWTLQGKPISGKATHQSSQKISLCKTNNVTSPNGELRARVNRRYQSKYGTPMHLIQLYNRQGDLIRTFKPQSEISQEIFILCFSQDGQSLASGGAGDTLLWDLNGQVKQQFRKSSFDSFTHTLLFSNDGKSLIETTSSVYPHVNVTTMGKHKIYGWKVGVTPSQNWEAIKAVTSLVFSPDGRQLAMLSQDDGEQKNEGWYRYRVKVSQMPIYESSPIIGKTRIYIQNFQSNELLTIKSNERQDGIFTAIDFHPDGQLLAAATSHGKVFLWRDPAQTPIFSFQDWTMTSGDQLASNGGPRPPGEENTVTRGEIQDIQFVNGGKTLIASTKWFMSEYDLQGSKVRNIDYLLSDFILSDRSVYDDAVFPLSAISTDGKYVVHARLASPGSPYILTALKLWSIFDAEYSPKILPDISDDVSSPSMRKRILPQFFYQYPSFEMDSSRNITDIAFSPDNRLIVTAGVDNVIRLRNLNGEAVGEPFRGHWADATVVIFSPDGQTIASGSEDGTVRLWNLQGQPIADPLQGHTGEILALAFSPDGKTLASSSVQNVRLWDLEQLAPVTNLMPQYDETSLDWVDYTCDRIQGFLLGYQPIQLPDRSEREASQMIRRAKRTCQRFSWKKERTPD
jgi:WD40 repeat protein